MRYEDEAEEDLRKAIDFGIENDLPDPVEFVVQLRERIKTLATQPKSSKQGRQPGTREWPLAGTVYNVVYRVAEDEIQMLRVMPPWTTTAACRWSE
ncbi:MAG: type II toxin-antitoxin system RelE/ParE family toxin [Metallibacterium sp.]